MSKLASFIIPFCNRPAELKRCLESIEPLTTDHYAYEAVIIDDASTDPTIDIHINGWKKKWPTNITVLRFREHMERIYAFNAGMLQAEGEWIIHLDSDDEMKQWFKQEFEKMLEKHPLANILVWKGEIHWRNGKITERPLFRPAMKDNGQCEEFKSGVCFSGGFAFRKKCLNVTGYLPEPRHEDRLNPWKFGEKFLNRFKELKPLYTLPDGRLKTDIGNPWGNDFAMMYMLTRHWMPYSVDKNLHITHVRP